MTLQEIIKRSLTAGSLCMFYKVDSRRGVVSEQWSLEAVDCLIQVIFKTAFILSQKTSFRRFQTERVADDNFKFDENGGKFSKLVENTVGKGEIARYKQFLLFPQCFQQTCTADT